MAGAWQTLAIERAARSRGYRLVAGIDEVGRGCLAGPVVAAAVILPLDSSTLLSCLAGVRDSKSLTAHQREALVGPIEGVALGVGVGVSASWEVDEAGIVGATRRAMVRAVNSLPMEPDALLIDALHLPELPYPQSAVIKGDQLSLSIAAASIVAKVRRDQWMVMLDDIWPGYGFAAHKGYGTAMHRKALARLGPTRIHRRSFAPVSALLE